MKLELTEQQTSALLDIPEIPQDIRDLIVNGMDIKAAAIAALKNSSQPLTFIEMLTAAGHQMATPAARDLRDILDTLELDGTVRFVRGKGFSLVKTEVV